MDGLFPDGILVCWEAMMLGRWDTAYRLKLITYSYPRTLDPSNP